MKIENLIWMMELTSDLKIGKGKPILLLHTFRNRLEYSDKLGELLKNKFTVYSLIASFGILSTQQQIIVLIFLQNH